MKPHFALLAFTTMRRPAGASIACCADADCAVGNRCAKLPTENCGNCRGGLQAIDSVQTR